MPIELKLGMAEKLAKKIALSRFTQAIGKAHKEGRIIFNETIVEYMPDSGDKIIGSLDKIASVIFTRNWDRNESNAKVMVYGHITQEDIKNILLKIKNKDGGA